MKRAASLFLLVILAGCSAPQEAPVQKAQQGKMSPERSLNMESLCKDKSSRRFNSDIQKSNISGFERFQGSYELRGYSVRIVGFVCWFDADGQCVHLSMR